MVNCRSLSAVDVASHPLTKGWMGSAFWSTGVFAFSFFQNSNRVLFYLFCIGALCIPFVSLAQTEAGAISRSQCVTAGGTPVNLTSVQDRNAVGGGFYWESADNPTFTGPGLQTPLSIGSQTLVMGPHTTSTYYRRVFPTGLPAPNDFYYSNTVKISVVPPPSLNAPVFVPTGVSAICEGYSSFTVSFTLVNAPNRYSIIWDKAPASLGFPDVIEQNLPGSSPLTINVSATAPAGTYSGTLIPLDANGCSISGTNAGFSFNPKPTVVVTNPAAVCAPGVIDLTSANITSAGSTSNLSYTQWNDALTTSSLTNASAVTVTGTYYIKGTIAATGCSVTQPVTAIINALPTATITPGGPITFCAGGSVNLSAPLSASYSWSTGAATQSINITSTGSNTVTITDVNGCSATSSATSVTVNALPTATITPDGPTTFCAGGSVNLSAPLSSSYSWGTGATTQSIHITNAGSNTVTITDVNGCSATSSATTVTVNPLPAVSVTNPAAVCSPAVIDLTSANITSAGSTANLSYTQWNNALTTSSLTNASSITATGVYYIKGTIAATGCSVTQPVTATINPLPTVSITNPAAVCAPGVIDLTLPGITTTGSTPGLAYTQWNNVLATSSLTNASSITASGVYYIKGTIAATGCSVTQPVTATINPLPVVNPIAGLNVVCVGAAIVLTNTTAGGAWNSSAPTIGFISSSGVLTGVSAGTTNILYTVTDNNNCTASVSSSKSVSAAPVMKITNPAPVCAPGTVDITSPTITAGSDPAAEPSYWGNANGTGFLVAPNSINVSGTYYIKGTVPATGCSSLQPVLVNINPSPTFSISDPVAVCEPATVNITAAAVTNGTAAGLTLSYWKDPAATTSLAAPASLTASGTYYIKGVNTTNCSVVMPVSVTVNLLPSGVLQTPSVNFICDGTPFTLTASNASDYQWYNDQQPIGGATVATYLATKAGNYTVQFSSIAGCRKMATNTIALTLFVRPVLAFTATGRCITSPIRFNNTSITATSGSINWLWDFGDGSVSNNISPTHTYRQAGNYNVSVTANNVSCPAFTGQLTTAYNLEAPAAAIRYDTVFAVNGRPVVLAAREIGSLYQWSPSTGLSSTSVRTPTATLTADASYTVTITSSAGCVTTDTVSVKLLNTGEVYVAQGFTPNGDGLNDRAHPILAGVRQLVSFKIFNRWGNLVFQTNSEKPENGWDGKFQGRLQQPGTYTWTAEAIDGNGNIIHKKGSLLLIN